MASAQTRALRPFLFWADHLVLKGHTFGIVFLKPFCGSNRGGEDLKVLGVANLDKDGHCATSCTLGLLRFPFVLKARPLCSLSGRQHHLR
jgi:hypothetical protein